MPVHTDATITVLIGMHQQYVGRYHTALVRLGSPASLSRQQRAYCITG